MDVGRLQGKIVLSRTDLKDYSCQFKIMKRGNKEYGE